MAKFIDRVNQLVHQTDDLTHKIGSSRQMTPEEIREYDKDNPPVRVEPTESLAHELSKISDALTFVGKSIQCVAAAISEHR